jgi:glycosidase
MFAVDKYYGTREALKRFIDECHSRGIAVILDMVLNHQFGQSPLVQLYWDQQFNRPSAENPWFNQVAKHDFNVGYDFNHESPWTQEFVDRVNRFWLEEFRFDGYRYDLSKGFMQTGSFYDYNASRIALLKRMYDKVREYDSDAYMILEHLGANNEEKELSDYGFMLWGKMTYNYNEATMGYNEDNKSDISWISYQERGWSDPHVVGYMESHDEERLMYKNLQYGNSSGSYDITNLVTALQRMKMAAAFFFTIPGPKMIWQFGELGYDFSINYPSGTDNDRLTPKPIRWDYFEETGRYKLYKVFSSLAHLKQNYPVFSTDSFDLSVSGAIKKIKLYHDSMNVYIIGNFGVTANGQVLDFPNTGTWYDYFSGDSLSYTSSAPFQNLEPGEFHIYTTEKLPTPEGDIISGLGKLDDTLPSEFFLGQNYPNPFNPTTSIQFSISKSSLVNLSIYNILGEKVRTLVSKEMNPGSFEVAWDGKNDFNQSLSSGVYIYKISADNFVQSKKMILIK